MAAPDISTLHAPAVLISEEPPAPEPSTPADYPRPVHPTDEQVAPPPHHEEEVPLKKEKKHNNHESDKHARELAHRKIEATRPSKEHTTTHKGFGAAGRIGQPIGKFGI
ncbi:hypothetical protein H0H81_012297 [Sphagnurus paluster]|uniref:Uncharacterized protein n=1 Tax=Sphagnurus paluster TaxID=117069 RepID=A0A9P7FTV7_9AGAR|nr:hypothetical protein H0H81_012297 [Sphagnurus paluster]